MGGHGPCPPCFPPPPDGRVFPGELCCSVASTGSRWVGRDGTKTEQRRGQEVGLRPHGPVPLFPGACLVGQGVGAVGQGVTGSTAGAGQEPVAALLPRPGSSRAGPWLCCLLAGAQPSSWEGGVLGRAHKMCAGRRVSVFCPRRVVLPVGDSQFPTQSPGPQPRGGDTCASLQCFSAAFLCVYQRPPSKKAPRGCVLFRAVREGCGTWPGESIVYPARCQPTGHRGHSATLEIVTRVLLPSRPMTHVQLLRRKEITPCSGNFSHLFLIVDDELGALFLDDRLDPDFMPVPEGQPRGQSCLFP